MTRHLRGAGAVAGALLVVGTLSTGCLDQGRAFHDRRGPRAQAQEPSDREPDRTNDPEQPPVSPDVAEVDPREADPPETPEPIDCSAVTEESTCVAAAGCEWVVDEPNCHPCDCPLGPDDPSCVCGPCPYLCRPVACEERVSAQDCERDASCRARFVEVPPECECPPDGGDCDCGTPTNVYAGCEPFRLHDCTPPPEGMCIVPACPGEGQVREHDLSACGGTCVPVEACEKLDCDGPVVCDEPAPPCPDGERRLVRDGCWDACVPAALCR